MEKKPTPRKAFNFLKSYLDVYLLFDNDKDKADFMDCILNKQFYGIDPTFDGVSPMCQMAYIGQKYNLDKSVKGFEDKTKKSLKTETPLVTPLPTPLPTPLARPLATPLARVSEHPCQQEKEKEKEKEQEEEKEEEKGKEKEKVKSIIKTKTKKTEKVFSDDILFFYSTVIKLFDDSMLPKTKLQKEKWLGTINSIKNKEKIPLHYALEIIKWTRSDDFWKTKFITLPKLLQTDRKNKVKWIARYDLERKAKQGKSPAEVLAEDMQREW